MPAASDWTTSVLSEEVGNHYRRTLVQCSGDGTMSYSGSGASGMGLPLPALGALGMRRNLDYVNVVGYASASFGGAIRIAYDKTTTNIASGTGLSPGSLRIYVLHTTGSGSINASTTAGWTTATNTPELLSGIIVTTGTIYLECYGW